MRGVRFNFVKRLVDFTPKDELMEIAGRVAKLGWHVVIYFEAVDLPELWDFFTALPTTVVVDHMGRPGRQQAGRRPGVRAASSSSCASTRMSGPRSSCPERLSVSGPPALDGERSPIATSSRSHAGSSRSFRTACSGAPTGRIPTSRTTCPTTGCWSTSLPHIATTAALQRKLLVDNPMRLYWPEERGV